MVIIKKVGKDHALKIAEKASAEIIYDIVKLEGLPFTLHEVQAAMSCCEPATQDKPDEKKSKNK